VKKLLLFGMIAALALVGCQKSEARGPSKANVSAPLVIGDYSARPLADWSEITSKVRKDLEAQDAALNATLPLQSHFQKAFQGTGGEIYVFSILDKPHEALKVDLVDSYLGELTKRFEERAADSDPKSAQAAAGDGRLWSWRVGISGQQLYKTIYLSRYDSNAIVVDLIAGKSMPSERFDSYENLCASLQ
jgi:hypothetical protein